MPPVSWVNDLTSTLGIQAGAGVLAGAIYAACSAAEKAARLSALTEISTVLKDPFNKHNKTAIPAVARKADEHRWQTHSQRQTSGQLNIRAEQQNERRN